MLMKKSLICLGFFFNQVLFPLKLELIILFARFICSSKNVVGEIIINGGLFNVFKFEVKDCFGEGCEFCVIF